MYQELCKNKTKISYLPINPAVGGNPANVNIAKLKAKAALGWFLKADN